MLGGLGLLLLVFGWLAQPMTTSAHIRKKYGTSDPWPEVNAERRRAEALAATLSTAGVISILAGVGCAVWARNRSSTPPSS